MFASGCKARCTGVLQNADVEEGTASRGETMVSKLVGVLVSFLMLLIAGCTPVPPRPQLMLPAGAPPSTPPLVASSSSVSPPLPPLPSLSASSSVAGINETLASLATETRASTTDYLLGPGDLLKITLYNVPESE